MNNILTSYISDPNSAQPFTGRSLAFLQNANKEMVTAICRAKMGEYYYSLSGTQGIAMSGLMFSNTFANIFEGWVFFAGELYYCAGAFGLNASPYTDPGMTPIFSTLYTSDPTADPLTFTDSNTHNVHIIRRVAITAGASGSGLFDLSNLIHLGNPKNSISTFPTVIAVSNYSTTTAAYEPITGATFTSPAYKASYKITFECTMQIITANGGSEGGDVSIFSGATAIATKSSLINYATVNGNNYASLTVVAYVKDATAGTVFTARVIRANANNASVANCQMSIERIIN